MTPILHRGSLRLLGEGVAGELPPDAREMIEMAAAESERLARLIDNVLDYQKMSEGKYDLEIEEIDISRTISGALRPMENLAAEQGVGIRADLKPVRVLASADAVTQVITNLVSNGLKFSPPQSDMNVRIEEIDDGHAVVAVADRGPGIPPEFRNRIFTPFMQAKNRTGRAKQGSGLGLSISKNLVERMGGWIWFDSEKEQGTTFRFTLPLAA